MAYFEYQGKSVYYEEYGQGEPLIFYMVIQLPLKCLDFLCHCMQKNSDVF